MRELILAVAIVAAFFAGIAYRGQSERLVDVALGGAADATVAAYERGVRVGRDGLLAELSFVDPSAPVGATVEMMRPAR